MIKDKLKAKPRFLSKKFSGKSGGGKKSVYSSSRFPKSISKSLSKPFSKNKNVATPAERKKLILIVDDDKPLVEVYRAALEVASYEVAVQYDGEQALKWLALNDPDLIIMDCMLPKFGGLSVMEALNAGKPGGYKKPVIMVSGLDREEYKLKSKELGAVAYLVKANASISEMVDIVSDNLQSGKKKVSAEANSVAV